MREVCLAMQARLTGGRQIGQATDVLMLAAHVKYVPLPGCGGAVRPARTTKIGTSGIQRGTNLRGNPGGL